MTAGAYVVDSVKIVGLDGEGMDVDATIRTKSFFGKVGCRLPAVYVFFMPLALLRVLWPCFRNWIGSAETAHTVLAR